MSNPKIKNVSKNIFVATLANIIGLILSFVIRKIFVMKLGSDFVGLNSLFTNLLGVLSFAELGIGLAVTASLYSPLNQKNYSLLNAYLNFYKKFLTGVALFIETSAFLLGLFIPFLIHDQSTFSHFQLWLYFVLFATSSSVSYLLTYKRILLTADQSDYINSFNNLVFKVIIAIFQILVLVFWQSYIWYLIIQISFTILSNIILNHKINTAYGHIFYSNNKQKLGKKQITELKRNIIGMISAKIGGIILTSTDNIIISIFLGLGILGKYANYSMIIMGVTLVLSQIFNSLTPSIGNYRFISKDGSSNNSELSIFNQILNTNYFLVLISSIGLSLFTTLFVEVWLGDKYVFSTYLTIAIIVNFAINQLRLVVIVFMSAYGLFWQQRFKSLIEATLNISITIILIVFAKLGIFAVLFGTIITNVFLNLIWEFFIIKKDAINKINTKKYFSQYFAILCMLIAMVYINTNIAWFIREQFSMLTGGFVLLLIFILESVAMLCLTPIFFKDLYIYLKLTIKKRN